MDAVKTYVVDWSRLNREGFRRLLAETTFQIVGDGPDTRTLANALDDGLAVDCVILDIDQGDGDALRLVTSTRDVLGPERKLVTLTSQTSTKVLYQAFAGGADALLHNDISYPALIDSLRLVMLGEKVFPSKLTCELLHGLDDTQISVTLPRKNGSRLTERETEILLALAKGQSNKVIANLLEINEATVKTHLKNIQRKLNVANRTQAAIWALTNGLCGDI